MKVLKDFGAVVQLPGNFLWTENLKVLFLFFLGRGAGRRGVVGIHFLYISGLCEKDGRYYLWLTKKQLGSKSHFFSCICNLTSAEWVL